MRPGVVAREGGGGGEQSIGGECQLGGVSRGGGGEECQPVVGGGIGEDALGGCADGGKWPPVGVGGNWGGVG